MNLNGVVCKASDGYGFGLAVLYGLGSSEPMKVAREVVRDWSSPCDSRLLKAAWLGSEDSERRKMSGEREAYLYGSAV